MATKQEILAALKQGGLEVVEREPFKAPCTSGGVFTAARYSIRNPIHGSGLHDIELRLEFDDATDNITQAQLGTVR